MKWYQIWLKGGSDLNGTMSTEDAELLQKMMKQSRGIFSCVDGEGDTMTLDVAEIAVFAYRDDMKPSSVVGFLNGDEVK